jgi:hypothetical protein
MTSPSCARWLLDVAQALQESGGSPNVGAAVARSLAYDLGSAP